MAQMKKHVKHYYRKITESLPQSVWDWRVKDARKHVKRYLLLYLSVTFGIILLYIAISFINYETIKGERLAATNSLAYWEEVTRVQANSPDAFYQAGYYAAILKEKKAIEYLNRAIELDPGFVEAISLREQLATRD